jgi:radical SAM protein with 4Fe4S-binding SPASM domain
MKLTKLDRKYKFVSCFDTNNGKYIRTGIIDKEGKDTGEDPFMASYPELIDIGVMGHCLHGSSGLCIKSGVQCYQDGLGISQPNMTLDVFHKIMDESQGKVFQVALGGRGDVNMHEQFEELLKCAREHKIVPNFTTSGLQFTEEHAKICKEYCGAVAVSWYRHEHTLNAIKMLLDAGVTANVHYVLGKNTIDEAISRLEAAEYVKTCDDCLYSDHVQYGEACNDSFPEGINAVIFLLHKPVGLGSEENILTIDDPRVKEFFSLIDTKKFPFMIGFDSCSIPAIVNLSKNINMISVDTCEGGRFSMYITPGYTALPCSFDQNHRWGVELSEDNTIKSAWNSPQFEDFRNHMKNSCPKCIKRSACMGGCPIVPQVVLCDEEERNTE